MEGDISEVHADNPADGDSPQKRVVWYDETTQLDNVEFEPSNAEMDASEVQRDESTTPINPISFEDAETEELPIFQTYSNQVDLLLDPDDVELEIEGHGGSNAHATKRARLVSSKGKKMKKRNISKWMIYLSERRPVIAKEKGKELSVAQVTKIIGEEYKNLSPEENSRLEELVRIEKEKAAAEAEAMTENDADEEEGEEEVANSEEYNPAKLIIPLVSRRFSSV
jgi:hypothetical protein